MFNCIQYDVQYLLDHACGESKVNKKNWTMRGNFGTLRCASGRTLNLRWSVRPLAHRNREEAIRRSNFPDYSSTWIKGQASSNRVADAYTAIAPEGMLSALGAVTHSSYRWAA